MRTQPPAAQDLILKTRNSLAQDPTAAVLAAAAVKSHGTITVGLYISLLCINQSLTQNFKSFNYTHTSLKVST